MSYDIYIGNAVIKEWGDDGELVAAVESMKLEQAPSFNYDVLSQHTNERHPGYSQWDDFCNSAGLHDLFFNQVTGLMRQHPGTFKITYDHYGKIASALKHWKEVHPEAQPRMDSTDVDGILARLLWLEWWTDWALENCKTPAIHNH